MPNGSEHAPFATVAASHPSSGGFAMPESAHPALSGIDLSQLSEEELLDAIAAAHEESLAEVPSDDSSAEEPAENSSSENEDSDEGYRNPFPREEIVALGSGALPRTARGAPAAQRYAQRAPSPLTRERPA